MMKKIYFVLFFLISMNLFAGELLDDINSNLNSHNTFSIQKFINTSPQAMKFRDYEYSVNDVPMGKMIEIKTRSITMLIIFFDSGTQLEGGRIYNSKYNNDIIAMLEDVLLTLYTNGIPDDKTRPIIVELDRLESL